MSISDEKEKKCCKCLGSLASLSFFMSFTVVNKMSSRLTGPTLQIICRQITPLLPVCLFTLELVYMEEARTLCLKHRALFGSVQIWPLSFHAIVSSPAYLSRPLQSCRTSTQWQWSGYLSDARLAKKALPGPLTVLGACVIEWLEWVGATDNKGKI